MATGEMTPAPDAKRCEADGCGAGQPLYATSGLVHCEHHRDWPNSKEGKKLIAVKKIDAEVK